MSPGPDTQLTLLLMLRGALGYSPLLDVWIILGIRIIESVYGGEGDGVYRSWIQSILGSILACSDFPLILSFCTHSSFHGLYIQ